MRNLAYLFVFMLSCSGARSPGEDAGTSACADVAMAASAKETLRSCAQESQKLAQKEGSHARAASLYRSAAEFAEASFRKGGPPSDAHLALEGYKEASRDLSLPLACASAIQGAYLAGDLAKDAHSTYAELYRIERRVAVAKGAAEEECGTTVNKLLAGLESFRPTSDALFLVDQELVRDGVALPLASASTKTVSLVNQVTKVDRYIESSGARIVIALERPLAFQVGDDVSVAGKPRTYIDLEGASVAPRDEETQGIVTRLRAEETTRGARVSLELDGKAYRKVFHLPEPYRIVIDIARTPPQSNRGRRVTKVVLDPGHGGNDPGAIGPNGIKEKDVTLAIAHKVAPVLAEAGLSVVLTRDDDRYLSLEERTARANATAADLFVSIHCNASEHHGRKGVETYVLDTHASDMANRLAARENSTSAQSVAELSSILASMRLADQGVRSRHFAELLLKASIASLKSEHSLVVDGGVHTAGFYVLVGARMPGVLIETSYISNPEEASLLATDAYQKRLADGIANAIRAYREGK